MANLNDIMFRIQARLDVLQRLGDFDAHAGVIRELYEIAMLMIRAEMEQQQQIDAIHKQLSYIISTIKPPNIPNVMEPPMAATDAQLHPVPPPPQVRPLDPLPGMQAAPQPPKGGPGPEVGGIEQQRYPFPGPGNPPGGV